MHKTVRCSKCNKIISQCRCISCDEPVFYEVRKECKIKGFKEPGNEKHKTSRTEEEMGKRIIGEW